MRALITRLVTVGSLAWRAALAGAIGASIPAPSNAQAGRVPVAPGCAPRATIHGPVFIFGNEGGNLKRSATKLWADGSVQQLPGSRISPDATRADSITAIARSVRASAVWASTAPRIRRPTRNPDVAREYVEVHLQCGTRRWLYPADAKPASFRDLFARLTALAALLAPLSVSRAQDVSARATEPVCLGFAFGAFTPKLDWKKAGHAPIRDGSTQRAPDGRDWASDQALPDDSSLYLFPSWWPVGVWVELATRAPAPGDTVIGRATALVALGNVTPPVASVRAWRVPCGRATTPPPAVSAPESADQRARPLR